MKKYLIAIIVVVVLGLLYWWFTREQAPMPAPQTATEEQTQGEVGGASTDTWEAVGKDGSAEPSN